MRKRIIFTVMGLSLLLSGCSGLSGVIEREMLEQAGIAENSDYQAYQAYSADGKLTQQGYYSQDIFEADMEASEEQKNVAKISFASNSYLDVSYFSDSEQTTCLGTQSCYLELNDSIYAAVVVGKDVASSTYSFSGFRIYQYRNGSRDLIDTIAPGTDGFILKITEQLIGADLVIEPVGDYGTREISLRDYYTDEDGEEHDLAGTWMIDDKVETGNEVEINPVASYIISYEYDSDEYFYLSSKPECFYSNNEDGIVIFERRESTDETSNYEVELHKYVTVSLESAVTRTVTVNDGESQEINAGNELEIHRLKYGDTITIVTNKVWASLETCRDLILLSAEELKGGYFKYTLTVPQKGGEFVFDPSEYSYEHGTITFKCFGEVVTSTQYLAVGSRISYSVDTVEEGYWLPDGEHVIVVGTAEETREKLNSIHFVKKIQVTLELPQPSCGGSIKYYADGKEITDTTITTESGKIITMEFFSWEGWINHYNNDFEYEVGENAYQTITINGNDVASAFSEDPDHKPALTVVLSKTVGESMTFAVAASGVNEQDRHYVGNWVDSDYAIIDGAKIGTETGIELSMGGRAIQSGTAVKVLIEKTDSEGEKTSEYRLIDDLAEIQPPILIYADNELGTSKTWYKSIRITISVVDVLEFKAPTEPKNATVSVKVEGTQKHLQAGDLLEGSENVVVTITPGYDYYVTGKNVNNNVYRVTMKFSKYQAEIQKIIDEHPVEKYIHITLDADDAYGTRTYTLDGQTVSGTIRVKSGQKLTLTYEITASGYVIDGANFLEKHKKSASTTLDASWDGKTINRGSFGISVVRGE